jgi:hypothetical protein
MLNARWFALAETLGRAVQPNQCFTLRFVLLVIRGIKGEQRSAAMWTHWEGLKSLSEGEPQAGRLNRRKKRGRQLQDEGVGNLLRFALPDDLDSSKAWVSER